MVDSKLRAVFARSYLINPFYTICALFEPHFEKRAEVSLFSVVVKQAFLCEVDISVGTGVFWLLDPAHPLVQSKPDVD